MDPLSGVASVIAIIQLTQGIGGALKDLYQGVRDARGDINALHNSIQSLREILLELEGLAKAGTIDLVSLQNPTGPLEQCRADLASLQSQLEAPSHLRGRRGRFIQSLKWPFQKDEVQKVINLIERHKSALALYLGTRNLSRNAKQYDLLTETHQDILQAQSETETQRILNWLHVAEPSTEHNAACQKDESGTGSWLVDGEVFQKWMKSDNSLLWINGGAGSGKTILCSTALSRVQEYCKGEPNSAVAYWYFAFADQQKQSLSNLLCSITMQLLSQRPDIPKAVKAVETQSAGATMKPNIENLLNLFHASMDGFEDVYLVIDALDECPKSKQTREQLLAIIREVFGWKENSFPLMVTSRRESDIEEDLRGAANGLRFYVDLPVEDNAQSDIRSFVSSFLQSRSFSRWKDDLKIEMETTLSERAQGMFRLVALQLDELQRVAMMSVAKIRLVMQSLPITLDEFYDRLLVGIDPFHSDQAFKILQWMAFAPHLLTLAELAETLIIPPENDHLIDPDDGLMDAFAILEILPSGLVVKVSAPPVETEDSTTLSTVDRDDGRETFLAFAHFSVKEYLRSVRVRTSPSAFYALDEQSSSQTIAIACLAYISMVSSSCQSSISEVTSPIDDAKFQDFSFEEVFALQNRREELRNNLKEKFALLEYASRSWSYHVQMLEGTLQPPLADLLLGLLRKPNPIAEAWELIMYATRWRGGQYEYGLSKNHNHRYFPEVDETPATLPTPTPDNFSNKKHISLREKEPFGYVVWLGLTKVAKLLLEDYRDRCAVIEMPWYYIVRAATRGWVELVQLLLSHGADVNAAAPRQWYTVDYGTALEGAAYFGHLEVARLLLDYGADVNQDRYSYSDWLALHPLERAVTGGSFKKYEMVRLFVDTGADVNHRHSDHNDDGGILALCGYDKELFKILLAAGADVRTQSYLTDMYEYQIACDIMHGDGPGDSEAGLASAKRMLAECNAELKLEALTQSLNIS